ncbi:MAG: hypothetical protein HY904_06625 [Deltaproteobacteria bacterium]|nr:hypothetical protein [Deltaproteobacteria bacterium]
MSILHVERRIQFKPELYGANDRTEWFKQVGTELAARKLTITVGPGIEIKNADDAVALLTRYQQDKAALATAIGLPAGVKIEQYITDLMQALDDCVKPTTDLADKKLDFGPSSEMSRALGLDTRVTYAGTKTPFGTAPAGQTFSVLGIQLSRAAAPVDPLKGQVFMDATTFAAMPSYQWARDSVELEQVFGVSGAEPAKLLEALRSTNAAGRTAFQRLRKPEASEAYTVGYSGMPLDEVKWDSDAHKMREKNRFVSLTIESGRFEADAATGKRELSIGTDKMDDVYYDTAKFDLLKNDYEVRGRARWDTDTEIRRLLIGVKANVVMDEFGNKRCDKVDVRNDSASAADIAALDNDVRRGKTSWNSGDEAVKPLKGLYDGLAAKGALPDVGTHKGVLQLQPQLHVRSVRSRYHLNETDLGAMQKFFKDCSEPQLKAVVDQAAKVKAGLSGADLKAVTDLESAAKALQDNSAVAKLAEEGLKKLDPAMTVNADAIKALLPDLTRSSWGGSTSNTQLAIDKKRVVADALNKAMHDFSAQLDGARRVLTQSTDRALEAYPDMFMAWQKSTDKALLNKTTFDPFLARYDAVMAKAPADFQADLKAFNDYGTTQKDAGSRAFRDFKPLDEAGFKALRPQLHNEVLRINQRQLEAAGSMAVSLWFDEARAFYVPGSTRNTGNFLIDSTDMSEFVKHKDWDAIPADKRTPKDQLPKDKVFHVMLVNETQIELGLEKPYLDRLADLAGKIHEDQASLVMKWLGATNAAGVNAADPASYGAALKALLGKPAAERDADLRKLNAFLVDQHSALKPLDAATLGLLPATAFAVANRDKAVRTTPDTERALEGARFVFEQYRDIQQEIVKAKGDRVQRVLKDAGLGNVEWKQTETSKGVTGLRALQG